MRLTIKAALLSAASILLFTTINSAIANSDQLSGNDYLSLAIGYYDIMDNDGAADLRIEYRPNSPIFIDQIKPWIGAEITTGKSIWAGGGLLLDLQLTENVYFTPSIGAGLYTSGSSDLDLDGAIQFRSQLEISYQFENKNRFGMAFSHLSNASLNDSNPGTEVLSLYWHMPF